MRSLTNRDGAALPLALLATIVLATLASAFLVAVTDEVRIARSRQANVEARFQAVDALAGTLESWATNDYARLSPGEERVLVGNAAQALAAGETRVSVDGVAPGLFLIHSSAARFAWTGVAARNSVALLVRGILPSQVWMAFGAAVTADSGASIQVAASANIDGTSAGDVCSVSPNDPFRGSARPGLAGPADAFMVDPGAAVAGQPPMALDTSRGPPAAAGLGPLDTTTIAGIADRRDGGSFALGGVAGGQGCVSDAPGNWGDPTDSTAACHEYFPLILGASDMSITGGTGQGILVATGPVRLGAGTLFRGLLLAMGGLSLDQGATVEGAVRVARGPALIAGTILYSRCAIAPALVGNGPLNRPFKPAPRSWVPSF